MRNLDRLCKNCDDRAQSLGDCWKKCAIPLAIIMREEYTRNEAEGREYERNRYSKDSRC